MFVDIENFKSALAVENILTPYKKGRLSDDKKTHLPKEPITPDVCMKILKSTNYARNIKDMLLCIAELPPQAQVQFKEVVLATFSNREQPNDILVLGKKLAVAHGFEAELAEAQKLKKGDFLLSSSKGDKGFVSLESAFRNVDFSAYEKLICLSDANINFLEGVKFPKILEFPNSSDVSFFNEAQRVGCDFTGVQSVRFKDGAFVNFEMAKNLPPNIDVSMCSNVFLARCDLKEQPNLSFKHGAKVELRGVDNLSPDVDFSQCSEVELFGENLHVVSPLVFREGAKVRLNFANVQLPQIDFSKCAELTLNHCDFKNVDCLIFKSREQMTESQFQRPDKWQGKLVFVDEQQLLQAGKDIDKEKTVSAKDEEGSHGADEKTSANRRWGNLVGKIFGKGSR